MKYCIKLINGNRAFYKAHYLKVNENYVSLYDEDDNFVQFVPIDIVDRIYTDYRGYNMNKIEVKGILLNKINEKAKKDLSCEEIRTLCEAWRVIAGQESLDDMKDMAFPFSFPSTNN